MRINRLLLIGISLLWILSLLAACAESSSVTQTPQESVQPSAAPLPSATPLPPRELNICIGQEPVPLRRRFARHVERARGDLRRAG